MPRILFFSGREFAIIVAVGIATGLIDDKIEMLQFVSVARIHALVLLNDYLAFRTGGPIFGDLLEMWLEFGGVLAACLVRKPAAGTIALTINGFCQVFAYGTHDPHLLYGLPGLGADIVFAFFRYRRYDLPAVCLAGIASAMFWYPVVWFTHGLYLYPPSFILSDLLFRVVGSTVGNGLFAFALVLVILTLARRKGIAPSADPFGVGKDAMKKAIPIASLAILVSVVIVALTYALPSVSNFFLSIGPKIPSGILRMEEYNPGYVIGIVITFLVLTVLAFGRLKSRISA